MHYRKVSSILLQRNWQHCTLGVQNFLKRIKILFPRNIRKRNSLCLLDDGFLTHACIHRSLNKERRKNTEVLLTLYIYLPTKSQKWSFQIKEHQLKIELTLVVTAFK